MAPKDLPKHPKLLASYSLRVAYLTDDVIRKAEQICVEWTETTKVIHSGKS
jgi:hypothetical protein